MEETEGDFFSNTRYKKSSFFDIFNRKYDGFLSAITDIKVRYATQICLLIRRENGSTNSKGG